MNNYTNEYLLEKYIKTIGLFEHYDTTRCIIVEDKKLTNIWTNKKCSYCKKNIGQCDKFIKTKCCNGYYHNNCIMVYIQYNTNCSKCNCGWKQHIAGITNELKK